MITYDIRNLGHHWSGNCLSPIQCQVISATTIRWNIYIWIRLIVESNASVIWLIDWAFERLIIYVDNIWCRNKQIWELNSQNVILPLLIHVCDHSTTQNVATFADGALIILNNCSLPPGSDCCQQNGETTFRNMVVRTLRNKFEFPILKTLIGGKYLRLIDVSFH